jgi:hypothetical protein
MKINIARLVYIILIWANLYFLYTDIVANDISALTYVGGALAVLLSVFLILEEN